MPRKLAAHRNDLAGHVLRLKIFSMTLQKAKMGARLLGVGKGRFTAKYKGGRDYG